MFVDRAEPADRYALTMEQGIRVLIVDDQRLFADLLKRVLDDAEGIDVVGVAETAVKGYAMARELAPDVVLMDYQLPDGNGVQAAANVLSVRPETNVVMVTASDDESVYLAAIEAGCSGFITKSTALDELEEAVRSVAAGEALISARMLARVLAQAKPPRTQQAKVDLSPREVEILALTARALTNPQIAEELHLSVKTVRNHMQNILWKLDSHSKLEAVAVASRRGLVSLSA
jgi:DNA-binding NarL/FixJ family response regulator